MTPLPQRSAEIKVEWLGGDWPWVSGKLSPGVFPTGVVTDRLPTIRKFAVKHAHFL